jgi:hypothetical protein
LRRSSFQRGKQGRRGNHANTATRLRREVPPITCNQAVRLRRDGDLDSQRRRLARTAAISACTRFAAMR